MDKNGKPRYNEVVFSDEQIQEIIDLYVNHKESSVKIGKKFGVGHKIILKVLHRNNIELMPGALRRKYTLNEHYFDVIDTQNKAYIFGFLLADGHNELKKMTIQMSLQEEDKYILERMRDELHSEKPLEFIDYSNKHDFGYTYKNQYRLEFYSSTMCNQLRDIGMVGAKSKDLVFPRCVSDVLLRHFVRGYFDGNGTISANTFSIVSTKAFCEELKKRIDSTLGLQYGFLKEASNHNGITYVLSYYRKDEIKKILEWLYDNADMLLRRKYEKYLTIWC